MRTTLLLLASLTGLAMIGAPAMADTDCASKRAALTVAVDAVLAEASADPIVLADLTAKVDAADAALKALNDACGDQAKTATMPPATAIMGGAGDAGSRAAPRAAAASADDAAAVAGSEMMERTGRTHVTVGDAPTPHGAGAAVVSQQAAILVADMRAAIAANDLAGIRKIAGGKAN